MQTGGDAIISFNASGSSLSLFPAQSGNIESILTSDNALFCLGSHFSIATIVSTGAWNHGYIVSLSSSYHAFLYIQKLEGSLETVSVPVLQSSTVLLGGVDAAVKHMDG